MFLFRAGFAIAILTLVASCSTNNAANSVQNETQTTQENNPVAVENTQLNDSQIIASAKPKSDSLQDTLIIPGKRVGAVTSKTTRTDLAQIFGESNLKDDTILQAEGTVSVPATIVNSDTKRSFVVFWQDETRQKISYLKGFGSEWKTPEGIGFGTSLKELRQKLGEFKLTGLGWDYGGLINLEGTKLSQYKGKISLTVAAEENISGKFPKEYTAVSGDQELSSTNANFESLNIQVYQVTVTFDE